ncbi:MAG: MBL fold metallo-hydrolase [Gemmatimonadetes bacterium]|nr:MBL fold metallo-hydrolase [Gemmatimonadota bacterium]
MTGRRAFLHDALSCAGHLALASAAMPMLARRAWAAPRGARVVALEPFGRLERVADGVWALVSTPLAGDMTTVANGGIVAGRAGVLVIEGFMTPAGARWLGEQARTLTGRWPTHVVCTHYHSDHVNGLAGYAGDAGHAIVHLTAASRDLAARNTPADAIRASALATAMVVDPAAPTTLDLGGRIVRLVPRAGHTASDVTIELDDPAVTFCGDLVWNAMFPNYVDARPGTLAASVRALRRAGSVHYVPGHGPVASGDDLARYLEVLGEVEVAARAAFARGVASADAAATFRISPSLGEWAMFSPTFLPRAFEAWRRELQSSRG